MNTLRVATSKTGHSKMEPYLVQVGEWLLLAIQKDLAGWLPHSKDGHCVCGDLCGLSAGMEDSGSEDVLQEGTA